MDPIIDAIAGLKEIGIIVTHVDEPWLDLYNVSDRGELTRGQVLSIWNEKLRYESLYH